MTMQIESSQEEFADELLGIVRNQTYRDPLIEAIRSGEIDRDGMKRWAMQALMFVREFIEMLGDIHSKCPFEDARELLAENIKEEKGFGIEGQDHYSLLKMLTLRLGATEKEISETQPLAETFDYIEYCRRITRERSFVESMTAIGIGIEFFMPKFFGGLAEALKTSFNLTDRDVEYLLVHVTADDDHARRSLALINRYADSPQKREGAIETLTGMLAVKHQFASALYSHCVRADY